MKDLIKSVCIIASMLVPAIILAIGWIMNIVKLASCTDLDGELALRIIGIPVVVIGAVYGWF